MASRLIALVAGALVALNMSAASAAEPPRAAGSAPVHKVNVDANGLIRVHEQGTVMSQVNNFPLDPGGNLRVSGNVGVTGTVEATQSGPWSVGLDPAASSSLSNIDTATSGLHYDTDGNLKVSMAGSGSPADPTPADFPPFGVHASGTITAGESITVNAFADVNVTSYFVEALEGQMNVWFLRAGSVVFGFRVVAGQSPIATASLAHAILADAWQFQCVSGSNCLVFYAAAAY
jgi:hypothetical protein